jgi:hypothetical protein
VERAEDISRGAGLAWSICKGNAGFGGGVVWSCLSLAGRSHLFSDYRGYGLLGLAQVQR